MWLGPRCAASNGVQAADLDLEHVDAEQFAARVDRLIAVDIAQENAVI